MEGAAVLITDFREGVCVTLLDFLIARNVVPYVLVPDFEHIHEVFDDCPAAIPIVLDFNYNEESTIAHFSALPTMSCVFNFDDGGSLENLYRQTFEHFNKTIVTSKDSFDAAKISNEMMEAISDGFTLIVNFTTLAAPIQSRPSVENFLIKASPLILPMSVATTATVASSRNLSFVLEKLFSRHPEALRIQKVVSKCKKDKLKRTGNPSSREANPISRFFKKIFTSFNPCATTSVLNMFPVTSRSPPIKSPEEINTYIRSQENHDIKIAFQTIHESALTNWSSICEEKYDFNPPELDQRFTAICQEIKRKGDEGRKLLLDKVNKDIECTKQWDHVLGDKTVDRLRCSREKEIELKVQHFCTRKIAEARKKINEEIQQNKEHTKAILYGEILEEQLMELMRIKGIFQKRKELLMLPYTGELKILG